MSSLDLIRTEIHTYFRELPRLLAEGYEGKHALIKGNEVLSTWDTFEDAYQAGRERFGLGVPFIARPIDSRDLTRPYPEEFRPRQTVCMGAGYGVDAAPSGAVERMTCPDAAAVLTAGVTTTMSSLDLIRTEIQTYFRELPRLLAEGQKGKYALIKGNEVLSVWDTFEDAYQAGLLLLGLGVPFIAQPIDSEDLTRPYPEEFRPRQAV